MPEKLPPTATPIKVHDMASAMVRSWTSQFGAPPNRASVVVLLAQWLLETGGGDKTIQYNVGNAKSHDGDGYDWCEFPTTEMLNGQTVHVVARFRAFRSLDDGVADYLKLLSRTFRKAWPFVLSGDPEHFARALHDEGYYTAPVDQYVAGLLRRFALAAMLWPAPAPDVDVTDGGKDEPVFAAPVDPSDGEKT